MAANTHPARDAAALTTASEPGPRDKRFFLRYHKPMAFGGFTRSGIVKASGPFDAVVQVFGGCMSVDGDSYQREYGRGTVVRVIGKSRF